MRAVLTYHSIDDSGSPISIPPAVFSEHVRWMSQSGVRVVSLDELLAPDAGDGGDAIALTFDDGFANFREAAAVLAEHGLPASVFIVTDQVGRTNAWGGRAEPGIPTLPLLGWSDLERLVARGVSIGAHTRTHSSLTALSEAAVTDEMDGCVDALRTRLGVRPGYLAYPYGAVNAEVEALASGRFRAALTTRFAPLTGQDPCMRVPRLDGYYLRRPGAIHRWGTPAFGWWLRWVGLRRSARAALGSIGTEPPGIIVREGGRAGAERGNGGPASERR